MESWLSPVCFIPDPGLKLQPELKRSGKSWLGQIRTGWSWRDLMGLVWSGKVWRFLSSVYSMDAGLDEVRVGYGWIWLGTPWMWLDLMILKVFSNPNDSVFPWLCPFHGSWRPLDSTQA